MATLRIIVMLDDNPIADGRCELSDRKPETVTITRNGHKAAELVATQLKGGVRLERYAKDGQKIHEFIRE